MKQTSDSQQDKGIETEREGKRELGRHGHRVAHTGAERKRTPGNRPEHLWGKEREMQITTKRWKRKKQRWVQDRDKGMGKKQRGRGSRTQE